MKRLTPACAFGLALAGCGFGPEPPSGCWRLDARSSDLDDCPRTYCTETSLVFEEEATFELAFGGLRMADAPGAGLSFVFDEDRWSSDADPSLWKGMIVEWSASRETDGGFVQFGAFDLNGLEEFAVIDGDPLQLEVEVVRNADSFHFQIESDDPDCVTGGNQGRCTCEYDPGTTPVEVTFITHGEIAAP